jgi:hypothetical protein
MCIPPPPCSPWPEVSPSLQLNILKGSAVYQFKSADCAQQALVALQSGMKHVQSTLLDLAEYRGSDGQAEECQDRGTGGYDPKKAPRPTFSDRGGGRGRGRDYPQRDDYRRSDVGGDASRRPYDDSRPRPFDDRRRDDFRPPRDDFRPRDDNRRYDRDDYSRRYDRSQEDSRRDDSRRFDREDRNATDRPEKSLRAGCLLLPLPPPPS